jgi:TDG/mug DNA glycosylase family protein
MACRALSHSRQRHPPTLSTDSGDHGWHEPGGQSRRYPCSYRGPVARSRRPAAVGAVLCGVNAPKLTVESQLHFARPGNRFWPALHGAGFTPRLLTPSEHTELAHLGYGITKLAARSTARADELSAAELEAAVPSLVDTAARARPGWIAILGISAFRIAFARPRATFGRQDLLIAEARVWVLPNPSGLNRRWSLPSLIAEYSKLHEAASAQAL